jgi:hypothetical protein
MTETPAEANSAPPLDDADALQRQLDELQRRNEQLEAARPRGHGWKGALRATTVVVLITLGAVFITASVPAIWGRNLVLNTDRYVETLRPLATDPGVQQAVIKAVDQQFANNVDVAAAVQDVLPARASALLSGPLQSAATSFVNAVATRFVESSAFVTLWETMNRLAHTSLVAILTGKANPDGALTVKDGILSVDLAPIIAGVRDRLVAAGLGIAANVPTVGATIELMQLKGLTKAQSTVRLFDRVADLLPILALLCFAGAVFAARSRRRAVVICALATVGGMVVLAAGVLIGRRIYLDSLPLKYLTADDAGRLFDTMVRFLREGLRIIALVALLVVALAWLTGSSGRARGLRRRINGGARALTSRSSNWRYAGVLAENRRSVAIGIGALAALILLLWTNPSLVTVLVIALVTAALIVVLYALAPGPSPPVVR